MKKKIKKKIIEILKTWFYPQKSNVIGIKIKQSNKESNYDDIERIVPRIADQILELFEEEKQEIRQDERSEIVAGLLKEYAGQESQIIDAVNFIHKIK